MVVKDYPQLLKVQNQDGDTPLHKYYSSNKRTNNNFQDLVFSMDPTIISMLNNNSESILHLLLRNITAVDDYQVIEDMCSLHEDIIKIQDNNLDLPLHIACKNASISPDIIVLLFKLDQEGISVFNAHFQTPLHLIISNHSLNLIETLISSYPYILLNDRNSPHKLLNISLLVMSNNFHMIEYICQLDDFRFIENLKWETLTACVENQAEVTLKYLLSLRLKNERYIHQCLDKRLNRTVRSHISRVVRSNRHLASNDGVGYHTDYSIHHMIHHQINSFIRHRLPLVSTNYSGDDIANNQENSMDSEFNAYDLITGRNSDGDNILHFLFQHDGFLNTCSDKRSRYADILRYLLKHYPQLVEMRNNSLRSPYDVLNESIEDIYYHRLILSILSDARENSVLHEMNYQERKTALFVFFVAKYDNSCDGLIFRLIGQLGNDPSSISRRVIEFL